MGIPLSMGTDKTTVVITDINQVLQAPAREAREKAAALLVVGGPLNGRLYELTTPVESCGRSPENSLSIDQDELSRFHFRLTEDGSAHLLEDCGSTNGTWLNDARLTAPRHLVRGDMIKAGALALKYLPKGDPERLIYDKLSRDANTDRHTGCYNKTYFLQALEEEVARSRATGNPLALIVMDLDHFKQINDTHGHDAGDYVLQGLAALVRQQGLREGDLFARYGGEEFVILLPGCTVRQGLRLADRLRALVKAALFSHANRPIPVTLSAGVAGMDDETPDGAALFRKADMALLRAKSEGRNRVVGK